MKKRADKKRKVVIVIVVLIVLIGALLIFLNYLKENEINNELKAPHEIFSVEELLKYYGCKDINIKNASDESFTKDIYLKFGEDLWKEDISNEGYFSSIIFNLTNLLNYDNYRIIDSSRELVIAVMCNKESKQTSAIYINGQINYFQKETAKKQAEKNYKKIESTNFSIDSEELRELINNNWQTNTVNFGTIESRFEEYDIYFDEGIEVKTIGGKIYNIIFTESYSKSIINGLKVNSKKDEVTKILGEPTFEEYYVFGYKGDNIYVFFSENAISVYRTEDDYKQEEFLKIWNEFNETKNAKTFADKIKDLWQDYDKYLYDSSFLAIQYTIKGIKIEFNTNGENGLILYNNFKGEFEGGITLDRITRENLPEYVYLHTDEDLVFIEENQRVMHRVDLYSEEYIAMLESDGNTGRISFSEIEYPNYRFNDIVSNEFNLIYSYSNDEGIYGAQFISKNRTYPDSELIRHKQIYTYGWINDEQFVYSVKGQGIYYYNAKTRALRALIEGNEDYFIKGIEDGKLLYDDKELNLR